MGIDQPTDKFYGTIPGVIKVKLRLANRFGDNEDGTADEWADDMPRTDVKKNLKETIVAGANN